MNPGRNDPCPCGSGKKYKKCHGAQESAPITIRPGVARANALKALDVELVGQLLRFAKSKFGEPWLNDAFGAYVDFQEAQIPGAEMHLAVSWVLFSIPTPKGGMTIAETWRRQQQRTRQLSPDTRLLLDAYANRWLSIWNVTEVERGVGCSLVDALTREERFVYDATSSGTLQRHDALLASVLDCGEVSFFGGFHAQPLPPREAEDVVHEARRMHRVRTRPVAVEKLRDSERQLDLIDLWNLQSDALRLQPPPILHNTDGDLIVPTSDDFELVAPREQVSHRLATLEGAQAAEKDGNETVFVITKPGNAQHREWNNTVIGRIVVSPGRLRVESNSARRADALRSAVTAHLEGMVRFRLRSETSADHLMEQARSSNRQRAGETSPEMAAAAREFRERHMTAWLDDSIPALGGLTPREAANRPAARRKLELLLKEFERSESRLPENERIDISRLRATLGF